MASNNANTIPPPDSQCRGSGNTVITGTNGDDTLIRTTGSNIINGLGGNDGINGCSGNDIVNGGAGNDGIAGSETTKYLEVMVMMYLLVVQEMISLTVVRI